MLLQYFGFHEDPFGANPDPRCLFQSNTHREALASLKLAFLSNRGFTVLIAPPGMGKTTLLFDFLEGIRKSARTVFLFDLDAQCEPRELMAYILRDIGIQPGSNSAKMHEQLKDVLVAETRAGRKFVVVIDEAQNLSEAALETVRLLSNFETSRAKLLQIVLAGQPQLADKLMKPSLMQLQQRISTFCRLQPFSMEDTAAYIDHRVKHAGYSGKPLFSRDALGLITEASRGIPRTINTLCFNSLTLCRALNGTQVDRRMVAEVIADRQFKPAEQLVTVPEILTIPETVAESFEEPEERKQKAEWGRPWVLAAIATLVAVAVIGALGVSALRDSRAHNTDSVDATVPPAHAVPAPRDLIVRKSSRSRKSFAVKVEVDEPLRNIALRYLGDYDLNRLHQIQALNPKLIDPEHIKAGQTIWLPGSPAKSVANNVLSANGRSLP